MIVRGRGMTTRHIEVQQACKEATDQYIREVAGKSSAEHIADAKALLDAGTISQAEFETLKAKALS